MAIAGTPMWAQACRIFCNRLQLFVSKLWAGRCLGWLRALRDNRGIEIVERGWPRGSALSVVQRTTYTHSSCPRILRLIVQSVIGVSAAICENGPSNHRVNLRNPRKPPSPFPCTSGSDCNDWHGHYCLLGGFSPDDRRRSFKVELSRMTKLWLERYEPGKPLWSNGTSYAPRSFLDRLWAQTMSGRNGWVDIFLEEKSTPLTKGCCFQMHQK